jgi:hypothetical protein
MSFTVNQTKNLTTQALSLSWTGGAATTFGPNSGFASNFVQVMQCWGEPVTTSASAVDAANYVAPSSNTFGLTDAGGASLTTTNYGPAREHCEFGATGDHSPTDDTVDTPSRITRGAFEQYGGLQPAYQGATPLDRTEIPFLAATGDVVTAVDGVTQQPSNPMFDQTTTNEISGAQTFADHTGHVWFQADNAYSAPGLGCGESYNDANASNPNKASIPCWLVIVPRGATQPDGNPISANGVNEIQGSPLTPQAWANRISIPLDFQPVNSTCPVGADERDTIGSGLVANAISSWQPVLCENNGPTFGYSSVDDTSARQLMTGGTSNVIFASQPVDQTKLPAGSTLTTAPMTLSGVTIGFNISQVTPQGVQLNTLKLTPRLVAKLLTNSYQLDLPGAVAYNYNAGKRIATDPKYDWLNGNPQSLVQDPDFIQYNGSQWNQLVNVNAASMITEIGSLDAAKAVWDWIEADTAARDWLSGVPDQWGMVVDPYFSTGTKARPDNAFAANPSGAAFVPADQYPQQDPWLNQDAGIVGHPLGMLDYHPYAADMATAAQATRTGNDGRKSVYSPSSPVYVAAGAQQTGHYFMMSITDTVSAQQFGLQQASLSVAGDDGPTPTFVAPNTASLTAGATAMQPAASGSTLLWPDPTATGGAYPLTMLTYAQVNTSALSTAECKDYATLLTYAASSGQTPGQSPGELPLGYVPLTASLAAQTQKAAEAVATCPRLPKPKPTPTKTTASAAPVSNAPQAPLPIAPTTAPAPVVEPSAPTSAPAASDAPPPVSTPASSSSAPVLILAAGTTPKDPTSFTAALPVGVIVGVLAGVAAPLLSSAGLQLWGSVRRLRLPRIPLGR